MTVAIEIHNLWSGTRASPNARHFGNLSVRLKPLGSSKFVVTEILAEPDLAALNCPTRRSFLPSPSTSAQQGAAYPGLSTRTAWSPPRRRTGGANSAAPALTVPTKTSVEKMSRFIVRSPPSEILKPHESRRRKRHLQPSKYRYHLAVGQTDWIPDSGRICGAPVSAAHCRRDGCTTTSQQGLARRGSPDVRRPAHSTRT